MKKANPKVTVGNRQDIERVSMVSVEKVGNIITGRCACQIDVGTVNVNEPDTARQAVSFAQVLANLFALSSGRPPEELCFDSN